MVFEHGIHDDQQLPHAGGEGDLRWFSLSTQMQVEGADDRVATHRGDAGHVERSSHLGSAAKPDTELGPDVDRHFRPLAKAADVALGIFDLTGRKVAGVVRKGLRVGEHSIALNLTGLGLPIGNYVYQLQISNGHGVHREQKIMTAG